MNTKQGGSLVAAALIFPILMAGVKPEYLIRVSKYDAKYIFEKQKQDSEEKIKYELDKLAVFTSQMDNYINKRKNRTQIPQIEKQIIKVMNDPYRGTLKTATHPGSIVPNIIKRVQDEGIPIKKNDRWLSVNVGQDIRLVYKIIPEMWFATESQTKEYVIDFTEKEGESPIAVIIFLALGPHKKITGKKFNSEDSN